MELVKHVLRIRANAIQEKQERRNKTIVLKEMPNFFGLMAVVTSSGLTGQSAIKSIIPFVSEELSTPIRRSIAFIESGKSFRQALEEWNNYSHLRQLAHVLVESMESGTSALPALDAMGRDSLIRIQRSADTAMKKLPVTMLFPLVLCILPAFMLLSVIPTLINGFSKVQW